MRFSEDSSALEEEVKSMQSSEKASVKTQIVEKQGNKGQQFVESDRLSVQSSFMDRISNIFPFSRGGNQQSEEKQGSQKEKGSERPKRNEEVKEEEQKQEDKVRRYIII